MTPTKERNLLVLDLDETLVHGTTIGLDHTPDIVVFNFLIYFRPGLAEFISRVANLYRLAVWTSATRKYAIEICQCIFQASVPLEFIWASERCTIQWNYETGEVCGAKRLHKLRKRYPLERVLVVDDSPEKHVKNYGNLIRVEPFEGNQEDRELEALGIYLESLANCTNVRAVEKRGWRRTIQL